MIVAWILLALMGDEAEVLRERFRASRDSLMVSHLRRYDKEITDVEAKLAQAKAENKSPMRMKNLNEELARLRARRDDAEKADVPFF